MTRHFHAAATGGTLVLVLDGEHACAAADACDAVDAALALHAHEPLVAALEQWLQQPLDPAPADDAGDAGALVWAQAGAGVSIGLPWGALERVRAPAPAVLAWPEFRFDVEVAALPDAPRPPPAGNGALLLPPAFEPPWHITLRARERAFELPARWRGPGHPPVPEGPARAPQRAPAPWRVLLEQAWCAGVPALLGWTAPPPQRLGAAAQLVGPGGPVCGGRIAPALGGAALFVDA